MDEEILDEMDDKVIRIREAQGFWSIPLTNWVKRRWPTLHAYQTATDVTNSIVYIHWAPEAPPAKQFRWYGRDRGVYGSLCIPLRKMRLRVPRDQEWVIPVEIVELSDAPFALVLRMVKRKVVKRDVAPRKSRAKRRPAE